MKSHKLTKVVLSGFLALTICWSLSSCKDPQEKSKTGDTTATADAGAGDTARRPAVTDRAKDSDTVAPARRPARPRGDAGKDAASLSAEQYWQVQTERRELVLKYRKEILEAYKEFSDKPEELKERVEEIRREQMRAMQDIWKKHDIRPHQFYPKGEDLTEVKTQRQEYLKENPEVQEKLRGLTQEINDVRAELREYRGRPDHRMRGRGGRRGMPDVRRPPAQEGSTVD